MRILCGLVFSLVFVTMVLVESTHTHEHSCDAPCAAACLGSSCVCDRTDSEVKNMAAPAVRQQPSLAVFAPVRVSRIAEDEIFHPPVA